MDSIILPYLYEIGETLGKLGYELCQQANSPEPLNIHGNVADAVKSLSYTLHNLASDLDKLRFNFIKNGECQELNPIDIETCYGAMQHLLHSSPYTHNGECTSLAGELHKLDYIISSLYQLKCTEEKALMNTSLIRLRNMNIKKSALIISGLAIFLSACSVHPNNAVHDSLLVGEWQQPNVSLKLDNNGKYHYRYTDNGYTNKQSGKYYADKDSVVLYGFYPDAYTPESKNERWTIRKLTPDSLEVYVHKNTVTLDEDTLNTSGNEIEIFIRKH